MGNAKVGIKAGKLEKASWVAFACQENKTNILAARLPKRGTADWKGKEGSM
jgi:hypothetical protein